MSIGAEVVQHKQRIPTVEEFRRERRRVWRLRKQIRHLQKGIRRRNELIRFLAWNCYQVTHERNIHNLFEKIRTMELFLEKDYTKRDWDEFDELLRSTCPGMKVMS